MPKDHPGRYSFEEARDEAKKIEDLYGSVFVRGTPRNYNKAEEIIEERMETKKGIAIDKRKELISALNPNDKSEKGWLKVRDFDDSDEVEKHLTLYKDALNQFHLQPLTDEEATLRSKIPDSHGRAEKASIQAYENGKKNYEFINSAYDVFYQAGWIETQVDIHSGPETGDTFISPDQKYVAQLIVESLEIPNKETGQTTNAYDIYIIVAYLDAALVVEEKDSKGNATKFAFIPYHGAGDIFYITGIKSPEHLKKIISNPERFADPKIVKNYATGKLTRQIVTHKEAEK